ncbi:MAG: hypothetical protein KKB63_13785, partial [Alphaproteobacteria bacterium]|nr:hypothetical protein [Alphaproteobacteria bacterium]
GSVSAARAGLLPPRFPAYDHLDALPCFRAVSGYVRGVLDGLGGASQMLPFERQDGVFRLKIEAAWLSSALTIGVLPGSAHHYMETCLIGGAAAMPGLRRRRVLGAARHRLPEQEALALARRPDMAVYRLSDCPVSAGEMLEIGLFQAGETLEPPDAIVFFLPQGAGTG